MEKTIFFAFLMPKTIAIVFAFINLSPRSSSISFINSLVNVNKNENKAYTNTILTQVNALALTLSEK